MEFAVRALIEGLRRMKERLRNSDAATKIRNVKLSVQNHPVAFTLLAIATVITLSPFLLITAVIMAPVFFILCSVFTFIAGFLIMCFSFFFGFFLNALIFASAVSAACCILHCIAHKAVFHIRQLLPCISSWFSRIPDSLKSRVYGWFSLLLHKFDSDLAQHLHKGNELGMEDEGESESEYMSALEEIKADYRDKEYNLHEASG